MDGPLGRRDAVGATGNTDGRRAAERTVPRVRATIAIIGLTCGMALALERHLARLPGMLRVYVNPATEMAYVEYLPDRLSVEEIAAAIRTFGYRTV